jgi:hypothetical protein
MVKHFSKRFLLAGLVLLTMLLTGCIVSVEQVDSDKSTTDVLNQAPGVTSTESGGSGAMDNGLGVTTDISKPDTDKPFPMPEMNDGTAILPIEHTVSTEALELQALEKGYMASKYYQQERMIPLTVTADHKYFIAYKVSETNMDDENKLILIGMPRQQVDLYRIDLEEGKSTRLGTTEFIISYAWSEDGKLLSLVSHKSVKILDVAAGKLTDVPLRYETDRIYNTNWAPDNHTLNIHLDTVANYYSYDSLSKKMLRTRGGYTEGDVVYRGKAADKILTSIGERVGVADGLYMGEVPAKLIFAQDVIIHDTDRSRILVSREDSGSGGGVVDTLSEYDADTGESRLIYMNNGRGNYQWSVFKASFLKTTGDVIYTIFEIDDSGARYFLVRIEPDGKKSAIQVPSPLYTVTPGESLIHFASFKPGDSCFMDATDFRFIDVAQGKEFDNQEIRDLMYRALDIYSSPEPDTEKIKKVFINSYDSIPQEALENIMLAVGAGVWSYNRLEIGKSITMTVKMLDKGNAASVALDDLYFWSPHELVKKNGEWFITGFSTWPESKVRKDVYKACSSYIERELKSGKASDVIPSSFSDIEVGEIEMWAMSEPHRAVYSNADSNASEARVKIVVTLGDEHGDGSTQKYLAYFSKRDTGGKWKIKSLGKLSPGLFPAD